MLRGATPIRLLRSSPRPSTSTAPTELPKGTDAYPSDARLLADPGRPIVIGHRGASQRFPENTLLSFQKALEAGAHAVELDVRLSRDGVPVVIHDATVDRTTGTSRAVGDLSLRELAGLDAGRGERIPSLADVLDGFRELPLLVEIKETAASKAVIEVLRDHKATDRVVVGSFEPAALRPFRRASIRTTASRRETGVWWAASRVGLSAPYVAYTAFSVPERSGRVHVVDRRFLMRANRRRIPVHVWTIDDVETAVRLWSWGVTGIITNCPTELVGALKRTGR